MAKSFDALVKRTTTKRVRDRAARRTQELLQELLLSEIRKKIAGKSQQQVARAIGIKQPSLCKLEKQSDMQISTLRRIVKALGGQLEVIARFPTGAVKMEQFGKTTNPPRCHRRAGKKLQLPR